MRILALARFRLLKTIRTAHPVFAIAFVAAAVPLILGADVFDPAYALWSSESGVMRVRALTVQFVYLLHLLMWCPRAGASATGVVHRMDKSRSI